MTVAGPEVDLLRALVEIPSTSGNEHEAVSFTARYMRDLGFRVHVDEVGNVHGSVGDPTAFEVLMLGHIDTVPGEVPIRREGNVLYGRGTVDAKGPLAAMICAADRISRAETPICVTVIGAVGEEADSPGARHLLGRPIPGALIIGEPSGTNAVGIGYKGVFRFRVRFVRPAAHTSSGQETAVEAASAFWSLVRERVDKRRNSPLFDCLQPSLVRLTGDLETAEAEISCRVPTTFAPAAFITMLDEIAGEDEVDVLEFVPAVRTSRGNPVAKALSAQIRSRGEKPVVKLKLGTSDWNVVGAQWPVPTAAYGPGDSKLCHTDDEHVDLTDYLASIDVLTGALLRMSEAMERPLVTVSDDHDKKGGHIT
ncbi:M20/M25/M40 family metallo-hydrolase [Nocardiopsis sp. NPDC055879]